MKRETLIFPADNISAEKLLNWASRHDVFTLLNSNSATNNPKDKYSNFDLLLAIDPIEIYIEEDLFSVLRKISGANDWFILHLSYDLKNKIEALSSTNPDQINFPEFIIYRPALVFEIKDSILSVHYISENYSQEDIRYFVSRINEGAPEKLNSDYEIQISQRLSRNEYISEINEIKQHIQRGDIYEMNYCQEFYSENATIDPCQTYLDLNEISPMPFSVFSRYNEHYLMCASPERYLAKRGRKIISQPIKGTARRDPDHSIDLEIAGKLFHDEKERSENVMIVDLVRNDLSRTAEKGTVNVEELFAIKTFVQLHQMISTVTSVLHERNGLSDLIRTTFPMGSMTGAPKIMAMEIIEVTERTKRGLYSGSVGYLSPSGDLDLNVVIRSILYNEREKYLSFSVGSAITIGASAEKEYDECLLKADAMKKVLSKKY